MRDEVVSIIDFFSDNLYIIDEKMSSKKEYKKFIKQIVDYLKEGFEEKELRECLVHFKFHQDGYIHSLQ